MLAVMSVIVDYTGWAKKMAPFFVRL